MFGKLAGGCKKYERDYVKPALFYQYFNPYHAGYFYVLHSSPIFAYLKCSIPAIGVHLKAEWKIVWILISWLLRSQLIWIYNDFKTR